MSFRSKVFLIFLVTVLASVSLVAYGVTYYTQRSFEQMDRAAHRSARRPIRKGICTAR